MIETHASIFSGCGGPDLAAEWMGWENLFHCEWNPFGQRVLKYYWPHAESFEDITKSNFTKYENKVDVLTGGFPCQPFSTSGEQLGEEDERYLFPEMLRAIREIKPRWIVAENVYGITSAKFKGVLTEIYSSLEIEGYQVQAYIIPSSAVEADHERERVFFVAHSNRPRQQGKRQPYHAIRTKEAQNWEASRSELLFRGQPLPHLFEHYDGLSSNLVDIAFPEWRTEANKAMGNTIHPGVILQIFKAIEQYEIQSA